MGSWRRIISASGAGIVLLAATSGLAAQGDPLNVWLTHCEPLQSQGSYGQGYSGVGYHNRPEDRQLEVHLAISKADEGDDITDALNQIVSIRICLMRDDGGANTVDCPDGAPWVIHDPSAGINLDQSWVASTVFKEFEDRRASVDGQIIVPLDWQADPHTLIFLRIVYVDPGRQVAEGLAELQTHGACANWRLRSQNPADARVLVYAPVDTYEPFGFDVCGAGSQGYWRPDGTHPGNVCIDDDQAEYIRLMVEQVDRAHFARLQATLQEG